VMNEMTLWEDGKLKLDSDGDRLSDDKERQLRSNPLAPDSNSNGISDMVEFRIYGRPCRDTACSPAVAVLPQACSEYRVPALPEGEIRYVDDDGDRLNNCEEVLARSHIGLADSNGDFVGDWMAFLKMEFIQGRNDADLDRDGDKIRNYDELKYFTPLDKDNATIYGLIPYSYQLSFVEEVDQLDCYSLRVENIELLGEKNRITVQLVETMPLALEPTKIRYASKAIEGTKIIFSRQDFGN